MSSTKYILAILLTPFFPFWFYFNHHEASLSNNQVDWGAFGSYMGGVTGPIVAAITLLFLIDSYRKQSKQSALQIFLTLLKDHVEYVMGYTTQYSKSYKGHDYLDWLWNVIKNSQEPELIDRIKKNYGEIQPLVMSIQLLIELIDREPTFNKSEKSLYVLQIYSRLTSVEMKLFLASALIDDKSKCQLKKYEYEQCRIISCPDDENWLLDRFLHEIKT
ncbi:hypothetical protein [Shewanella goraebulensis]|uniref:hypothetical protein n=1 Tax=Shewanella goraebulensis TaxID=3050637 RepID=UPI00254E0944|nr:hypothetical protein [Shewanella goraebulensis]